MGTSQEDLDGAKRAGRISRLALRSQPDDRLVALAREGRESAFEEIVRRYRAPLVRFAATIVPTHLAEDAVQDALVRAHRALIGGDSEISLRAWLYTIVRNGAVSELRKVRPTEQLDETINGVPQPPDIAERREDVRGVVARLKALPAQQREALVRTELGGASAEEIATALGTTTGAVGQLVFRARAALRSGAALILPMPVLRLLLSAPPGVGTGATASGGVLAGALGGGGGGGIAVKVGAAVVIAAIAVGPGRAPVGDGDRGGAVEIGAIEGGGGGGAEGSAAGTERHGSAGSTSGGVAATDAEEEVTDGVGAGPELDQAPRGGSDGSTAGTVSPSPDGGEVSSQPTADAAAPAPTGGGGGGGHDHDGAGGQPGSTDGYAPAPDDDGYDHAAAPGGQSAGGSYRLHDQPGGKAYKDDPYGGGYEDGAKDGPLGGHR